MSTDTNTITDMDPIVSKVAAYYSGKVRACGPTVSGVDWNSLAAQQTRFDQLLKLCARDRPFSLNDYGCGYGALLPYMRAAGFDVSYRGCDASDQMVAEARKLHAQQHDARFFEDARDLAPADYTVASGIFNVKCGMDDRQWKRHVCRTIATLAAISTRGFGFNVLTRHVDPQRMRPGLYHADPALMLRYCMRAFSRRVALLHDYGLFDFTILVRLDQD